MTHGILSTLVVAAFGLFAARTGDLFRITLFRRNPCDVTDSKGAAWSYNADAAQSERVWLKVQRHGTC